MTRVTRSCLVTWCRSGGSWWAGPVWAGLSGGHGREPDGRSIAHCGDGLQGHVARALGGPLVGLLQQQRPDKPDNGGLVREYADDIGTALDLAVEPLNRVG